MISKKRSLFLTLVSFLLAFNMGAVQANEMGDSSYGPPVLNNTSGAVGLPMPPVCDAASTVLHWNGSQWRCIAPPAAKAAAGSMIGMCIPTDHYQPTIGRRRSYYSYTSYNCTGALESATCRDLGDCYRKGNARSAACRNAGGTLKGLSCIAN